MDLPLLPPQTLAGQLPAIMRVLICDCATALELRRGSLLADARSCRVKVAVTDLLHERELRDAPAAQDGVRAAGQDVRHGSGLFRVECLPADVLVRACKLRRLHVQLSFTDAAALSLAVHRSWVLLTDDVLLTRVAGELAVETHDIAWLSRELARFVEPSAQLRRVAARSIEEIRSFYGGLERQRV